MSLLLVSLFIIEHSINTLFIGNILCSLVVVSNAANQVKSCAAGYDCVMDCQTEWACDSDYIECPDDYKCTVQCSGEIACWGAVIDATRSTELTIVCGGSMDHTCETIDIFCPPNVNGVKKCHIGGTSNGLRGCEYPTENYCYEEYNNDDNNLNFYARNGWLDIDFSGYDPGGSNGYGWKGGKMHCLDDYNANVCTISSSAWTCSDTQHACNMVTNMPTTAVPTQPTISPTTDSPSTNIPTTSIPTNAPTHMPTTDMPTTDMPTTSVPTTSTPTTSVPTTSGPTTFGPTTSGPTTSTPSTITPTTSIPTTLSPNTQIPTTLMPITSEPTGFISTSSPTTTNENDGEIGIETTIESDESDEKKSAKKSVTDRFETLPWILVFAGLVIVVICCIMIGIVRCRQKKRIYKNGCTDTDIQSVKKVEMINNIQLVNTNSEKNEAVTSFSNDMTDTPMANDEFIVGSDEIITPMFPENKYIENGNNGFIVNGNDEVVITPDNAKLIKNDEFIVNGDDDMMTPTCGENHVIGDQQQDEDEHTEGTDDDNIISDVNNMNIVTDMGNDEGDKANIMDAVTIE